MSRMVEIQGLPLIKPKSDSVQMWQSPSKYELHTTLLHHFLFYLAHQLNQYTLKIDFNRFSKSGGK